jgi:hypothetical protein
VGRLTTAKRGATARQKGVSKSSGCKEDISVPDKLKDLDIPSEKASVAGDVTSEPNLIVEGEFVAINEGDETKRIMIGFGRGASDVKTHVKLSLVEHDRLTVVLEFDLSVRERQETWRRRNHGYRFNPGCGGDRRYKRPEGNRKGRRFAYGGCSRETDRCVHDRTELDFFLPCGRNRSPSLVEPHGSRLDCAEIEPVLNGQPCI